MFIPNDLGINTGSSSLSKKHTDVRIQSNLLDLLRSDKLHQIDEIDHRLYGCYEVALTMERRVDWKGVGEISCPLFAP